MTTSKTHLTMARNLSQHSEILKFINDDRNLRLFIVLIHKNFTWNRELRGFGFSDRQIKYSIEFLLNKGLINVNNLEDLDIKLVEIISVNMPYGVIHPDLQVYTISDKGKEWAFELQDYIKERLDEFSNLLNKVSKKIQDVLPLYQKLTDDENSLFERPLTMLGDNGLKLYVDTKRGKEFKQITQNNASKGGYLKNINHKKELVLYNQNEIHKANSGTFYNGVQIVNKKQEEELLRDPDESELEGGHVGIDKTIIDDDVQQRQNSLLQELGIDEDVPTKDPFLKRLGIDE